MPDRKTLLKYLKIKALAESGIGGEQTNAQAMKTKMESKFPGIEAEARRYQRQQGNPAPGTPFPQGNWEPLFDWFSYAAQAAYGYAQQAANAQVGTILAQKVDSYIRNTPKGRFVVCFRMSPDLVDQMHHMNEAQQELFRAELHQRLEKELDELMSVTTSC